MSREDYHDGGQDWDFDLQKEDTDWMIRDLKGKNIAKPGQIIDLDIQMIPVAPNAGAEKLVEALRRAGFEAGAYDEDDGATIVEATAKRTEFSFRAIWGAERKATEIALRHGYAPDGWGFAEDDDG